MRNSKIQHESHVSGPVVFLEEERQSTCRRIKTLLEEQRSVVSKEEGAGERRGAYIPRVPGLLHTSEPAVEVLDCKHTICW
jgi:hypothetical protein